jgi:anti-sigma B factor antagonist
MIAHSLRRKGAMSMQEGIIERQAGSYIITLEGRLDSNTYYQFEERIGPVVSSSPRLLILDLEKLDYISSMGIRSIINVRKIVESQDGHVLLMKLQPQIQKVFEIVNALPNELVFASIKEADEYFDFIQKKEIEKLRM